MKLYEVLISVFEEEGLNFTRIPEKTTLRMLVPGKNGQFHCTARSIEGAQQVLFYAHLPINIPAEKRAPVGEFLTRANYGLLIGNFELDFEDGQVRYKTSIDIEGADLTPTLVRNLIAPNLGMIDRYLPGIMSIVYGNLSPTEAIARVEGE